MHDDDDSLSDVFAQFDDVVEAQVVPSLPSDQWYTQSRKSDIVSRLVGWLIRGAGLLALYLALLLVGLSSLNELAFTILGIAVVTWLISPLLGSRPLATGGRWGGTLLLASLSICCWAMVGRLPLLLAESSNSPISAFAVACTGVIGEATAPLSLLAALILGWLLLLTGRRLAQGYPWLETQARRRPWRRALSAASLALFSMVLLALPLGHYLLWHQSWMSEALGDSYQAKLTTEGSESNLGRLLRLGSPYGQAPTVEEWSVSVYQAKLAIVTRYLSTERSLSPGDISVVSSLLFRSKDEVQDPAITEFVWAVYTRATRHELADRVPSDVSQALRQHVLPVVGALADDDAESRKLWRERIEALPVPVALAQENVDWAFLEELETHRNRGQLNKVTSRELYHQPWRAFGLQTPWTVAGIAENWEKSATLLAYSFCCRDLTGPEDSLSDRLRIAYSGLTFLDVPIRDVFRATVDNLPFAGFGPDREVLLAVLDLKESKAADGVYPTDYERLPYSVVYHSSGQSATLTTPGRDEPMRHNLNRDPRYVNVTLK